ncbi:transport-associated [Luminiphilus syltensis NOR5-1B]|uniref:Transport-associated n=1 Tax=Luminiphilus syltensis NOR5-1B TaxID=565045 RepID=B8KR65_9GAMM|nr:BON domain-containing protein [Luminiphilus syltensis]EED35701.1 transport-associated [Luminiphilus syltensis NOR5-1B]
MIRTWGLLALLFSLCLSGCGSLLATLESDAIEEDPGERSLAAQVLDESIETKAIVNLRAGNDGFDDAHLVIVAYNGFVLLAGQVSTRALKDEAPDIVKKIEGVRRIYNELTVASNSDATDRAHDTWLTSQVKSALLFSSDTPSTRIKVVTEADVVYLMGLLTEEEADRAAAVAADVGGVERVIKMFEIIYPRAI